MSKNYMTVVFEIDDINSFEQMRTKLHEKFTPKADSEGWRVSAMSLGDELTRGELIEAAIREIDDLHEARSVIENICSTPLSSLEGKVVADFY